MFVAGMSSVVEPPINDLWTVPGEEHRLEEWKKEDSARFNALPNAVAHYFHLQAQDFLRALIEGREPLITGEDGRRTVEIFTAIYRSQKTRAPVRFPLKAQAQDSDPGVQQSVPLN